MVWFAKAGTFIVKHWRAIALTIMIAGASYSIVKLYEDNKELTGRILVTEDRYERCKLLRDDFADKIDTIRENLQEVELAREELEDDVENAEDRINEIRQERDRLLWEIENLEVPQSCEDKFDWLVDRFGQIRERYYEDDE